MRIYIMMLLALEIYSCHAQELEVNRINLKLDMTELQNKGAQLGKGRFLGAGANLAIGQIGGVDIVLIDLKSGQILKSIDTDIVIDSLEEGIHRLLGDTYYVPNLEENFKSKYAGILPYDMHGLLYLTEKDKFVIHMVTTVFNRNDDQDQMLFPSLVFFDGNLNNIEVIPFDPLNRSTSSAWANGGFFLGENRMFAKIMAWKHRHNFDFLEYRLTEDHTYSLADTLYGLKTDTLGYVGRFYECFAFNDKNYLNLGDMLYTFEGEQIKEGNRMPFPGDVELHFLYIEPIDENHLIGFATNNYSKETNRIGTLFSLDKSFNITKEVDKFNLREVTFCSLFTSGKSAYVANYDDDTDSYYLIKYDEF